MIIIFFLSEWENKTEKLMRITKATEENSHLPKGMNGSYVSKQNENRAGETKKKQRQMDRK